METVLSKAFSRNAKRKTALRSEHFVNGSKTIYRIWNLKPKHLKIRCIPRKKRIYCYAQSSGVCRSSLANAVGFCHGQRVILVSQQRAYTKRFNLIYYLRRCEVSEKDQSVHQACENSVQKDFSLGTLIHAKIIYANSMCSVLGFSFACQYDMDPYVYLFSTTHHSTCNLWGFGRSGGPRSRAAARAVSGYTVSRLSRKKHRSYKRIIELYFPRLPHGIY